jgi:hypothetical protein
MGTDDITIAWDPTLAIDRSRTGISTDPTADGHGAID